MSVQTWPQQTATEALLCRVFQAGTSSGQSLRRERWGSGSSATGETMDDLLSRLFSQVERLHVAE